jgi:hypothetical protein
MMKAQNEQDKNQLPKAKKEKTNFDVQEALEGKGKPRCDKIGVQLSGPYSDRFGLKLCSHPITSSVILTT